MKNTGIIGTIKARYPVHAEGVSFSLVGRVPVQEVVVLGQGAGKAADREMEQIVVVIKGDLPAAWWCRMTGGPKSHLERLVEAAQAASALPRNELETALVAFVKELEDHGLIDLADNEVAKTEHATEDDSKEVPFPTVVGTPLDPSRWIEALDLAALTTKDLVALGTFLGGPSNATSYYPCSTSGGVGNTTSASSCRPGIPAGLWNAGWFDTPCSG